MTPQEEKKEWGDYRDKKVPELRETFREMEKKGEINNRYWWVRMDHFLLSDPFNSLSSHYLGLMKLCVECVEHSKTVSPEILKHWLDYWGSFVMDTTGEAHCRLGRPYFPRNIWPLAEGEEKEEWEKIEELGHRFYDAFPKEQKL